MCVSVPAASADWRLGSAAAGVPRRKRRPHCQPTGNGDWQLGNPAAKVGTAQEWPPGYDGSLLVPECRTLLARLRTWKKWHNRLISQIYANMPTWCSHRYLTKPNSIKVTCSAEYAACRSPYSINKSIKTHFYSTICRERLLRHKGSKKNHKTYTQTKYTYSLLKSIKNKITSQKQRKNSRTPHILSRQYHCMSTDHILNVEHCTCWALPSYMTSQRNLMDIG